MLVNGRHRENTTWEYDLTNLAPSAVRALVDHPAVLDTQHIDRARGEVSADAPTGRARLVEGGVAGLIHSPLVRLVHVVLGHLARRVEYLARFGGASAAIRL